jgi:hypothetical protein
MKTALVVIVALLLSGCCKNPGSFWCAAGKKLGQCAGETLGEVAEALKGDDGWRDRVGSVAARVGFEVAVCSVKALLSRWTEARASLLPETVRAAERARAYLQEQGVR